MKAIRYHSFGGPEVLRYEDVPKPEARPGEVLIRVKATGVNPVDWKIRAGYMKEVFQKMLPLIPGGDVAGVVEEVGSGVTDFKPGDEVYGWLGTGRNGTYAEYVSADASAIARKPRSLDFIQAAGLPLAALVAWQTLFDTADLKFGQTVLIHGASGGVGHLAVQLAKWKGAKVIGTASSRNQDFLREIGTDMVIDYQKARFEEMVRNVDVVLDTQAGDTQRRSYKVLKKDGILVSTLGIENPDEAAKHGVRAIGFMNHPDGEELKQIADLIDEGKLKPTVSTVMSLKDAARAHELSQTGHARGKIVLKVD
ncbi:NADP-dependent oxidoreductase [Methanocella sp. MCL-LM]|uniref:NADP-dependent oxidoreductase n=1 Tax=Methanocella sp. MCL-LM TaxID=3412035 RepID=UPI003C736856